MDKDKSQNNQGQSSPPVAQQKSEEQSSVVTPGSSSQSQQSASVVTPKQTDKPQDTNMPSGQQPKTSGQPLKATAGTFGGTKSGQQSQQQVSTPASTDASKASTPQGQGSKQMGSVGNSAMNEGSSQQQSKSDPTAVGAPSSTGGNVDSPKTVNSTAASLGNVDSGLSAPPEGKNTISEVQKKVEKDDAASSAQSGQKQSQNASMAPGMSGTAMQTSTKNEQSSPDTIQTKEKQNEMMNKEAGTSGNNN